MLTVTAQLSRLMSSQCVHSVDSCMVSERWESGSGMLLGREGSGGLE